MSTTERWHYEKTPGKPSGSLSTGEKIENPRFFRKDEKALAKAQRRLSRCEKGTSEFHKYKRVVQHIHQRIANKRRCKPVEASLLLRGE